MSSEYPSGRPWVYRRPFDYEARRGTKLRRDVISFAPAIQVITDKVAPLDWTREESRDHLSPLEWIIEIPPRGHLSFFEWRGGIRREFLSPMEWYQGVLTRDHLSPLEWTIEIPPRDQIIPFEWYQGVLTRDHFPSLEWTIEIPPRDHLSPLEWRLEVDSDQVTPWESAGTPGVEKTALISLEWLIEAGFNDVAMLVEWLRDVEGVSQVSWESRGHFQEGKGRVFVVRKRGTIFVPANPRKN